MKRHIWLPGLLVLLTGCAAVADDASHDDDEAIPADEADLTAAAAPRLTQTSSTTLRASGLPLVIGLKAPARRELVFVDTVVPDGPDVEGHARFPRVTYQKRVVHLDANTVETPTGGVVSGTSLVDQGLDGTGGSVAGTLVDRVNAEMKQLWNAHPTGRFSVRMFPAHDNVATTHNGFRVQLRGHQGIITAANGSVGSYDAGQELAELEKNVQVVGGVQTVSTCVYDVSLKEAAVLQNTANVAIFHVQRTLLTKHGTNIACVRSEDKYVIGTYGP